MRVHEQLIPYMDLYYNGINIQSDEAFDYVRNVLTDPSYNKKSRSSITETYNVLSLANTDIRLIEREKSNKQIVKIDVSYTLQEASFRDRVFFSCNKDFYMIPLQTAKGSIIGFIFRALSNTSTSKTSQKYHDVTVHSKDRVKKPKALYGWLDFMDFDEYENPPYIVLTEDIKSAVYLKQFYPYVLSVNTSSMGKSINFLRNIANKFILCYDWDETGILETKKDERILVLNECTVKKFTPKDLNKHDVYIKDFGECINFPELKPIAQHKLYELLGGFKS